MLTLVLKQNLGLLFLTPGKSSSNAHISLDSGLSHDHSMKLLYPTATSTTILFIGDGSA